ncbi:MAG: hypothetical protein H5U40_01295 [Polyangiaceae bacterium]|nr:hypothetical protein [Polyangiaceae bacterium]
MVGLPPLRAACFAGLVQFARALAASALLLSAVARADGPDAHACATLSAQAYGPAPLESCLEALSVVPTEDSTVRGSLIQARLALGRAESLDAAGEPRAAARALRIARAALLLADRRLALGRARRGVMEASP